MAPARPSLNVPRARRALRTSLAGAVALLAVAAAARLVWPSGLHLAFIPDDAGNALGTAKATGGDFPEDVTVPSILPILGLRALSSLVRRKMDLDAGEDWATGGHRADDGGSGGNRAVGGRAGDGRPGNGQLSAGRRVAVVLHLAAAALVLCLGGRAAAVCARRWDTIARATGIGVTELLLIALMVIGLALAAAAGALSNALHTAHGDDPSPGGRWRPARWAAVAAPTLAAVLVLAGSAAVVQLRSPEDAPATQRTAVGLPANPTSFSPEPAWSRDIAELTDVVAGAAGPLILTPDGLQGLDPADGSPTWTFRRENITLACPEEDAEKPVVGDRPCLITSPDRSHAALRLLGPGAFLKGAPEYQTVVLDTVSGSPVMEHLSEGGRLQLTDDAVLDGRSAYSLKDGSLMWTLPEEDDYPRPDHYNRPGRPLLLRPGAVRPVPGRGLGGGDHDPDGGPRIGPRGGANGRRRAGDRSLPPRAQQRVGRRPGRRRGPGRRPRRARGRRGGRYRHRGPGPGRRRQRPGEPVDEPARHRAPTARGGPVGDRLL